LILHKQKIIFIHIPKTAGQSVTDFLFKNIDENFDLKNKKYGLINNLKEKNPGPKHYHHCSITEYKGLNLVDNLDLYFKFTVFRNPYKRFISAFYYNFSKHNCNNFREFIDNLEKITNNQKDDLFRHFVPQTWYINYDLKNIDCYFYQEKLEDLEKYFQYKFNFFKKISHINKMSSIKKENLGQYEIDFIKDYYKKDFEILGYNDYETP